MILKSCLVLTVFLLISSFGETQARHSSDDNILGVNVLGLKAGLNTNIFGKDGPLAKADGNLQTLKEKSDNFWDQVGQNTANFFNKVGSSLQGSSNGDTSSSGSSSQSRGTQGSVSGGGQSSVQGTSQTGGGSNFQLSLKGKSTDSWKSSDNAGSSSSGSSSTSGGGSGTMRFTFPTINLNGQSWKVQNQGSIDSQLPNLSENTKITVTGDREVSVPTITINGESTGSVSDQSSGGSSTWSLGGSSGTDSNGVSLDGTNSVWNRSGSGRSLPHRGTSTQESSRWSSRGGSSGISTGSVSGDSSDGSSVWSLEGSSGSVPGGSSALESSKWTLNGGGSGTVSGGSFVSGASPVRTWTGGNSGSASGGTSQNDRFTSEGSSKWSLNSGGSVQGSGQASNAGNGGGGFSQTSNSGGSSTSSSSGNLVGVNVLGLKAGLCTNLFNENGPLSKAGENLKNILEGKKLTNLDDLNNVLGVNIGDAKADLTTNIFGSGSASNANSEQEILGKTILGLHEGLNTNIFSGEGPLAKVADDLKNLLEGKLSLGDIISGKGSAGSSNEGLVGVNALGVKLALCTNLFDKDGPLAKAGADVGAFFNKLGETNANIWTNLRNAFGNVAA